MAQSHFALAFVLAVTWSATVRAETKTLKMGTLAPERSPWGQVLRAWSKAVSKKSGGSVELAWLWNGATGPEPTAVGKVKTGQLGGAALSATGLAAIYKPVTALQLPGTFASWAALDEARSAVGPEVVSAFAERGFVFGGWADTGVGRILSRGFEVRVPSDLRGHTPGYARESDVAPKLFEVIGGVTAQPGSAGEVLGALMADKIDVLMTTPLAAEQLQWVSRLTHVNTMAVGYGIGGIVLGTRALEGLAADQRELVVGTSRVAAKALTEGIRSHDEQAYARVKKRLAVHDATKAETVEWRVVFRETCKKVRQSLGDGLGKLGPC